MSAKDILDSYIKFFEKRGHTRIENSSLVPLNDPTTLFTSSGMQPLVPYLLGEPHPAGNRLVNVQNCFRAQDIDEIGDNRHTTFFRMLGNWSLGNYFKKEQLPWIWEFVTKELGIPAGNLYVTVFKGYKDISKDTESEKIWTEIFEREGLNPKERIFFYDTKNWWSRAGEPDKMPVGEPGGPDSEIFFKFDIAHDEKFGKECHPNCECGSFMEIVNSVFMEYQKQKDGSFSKLPQQNVDHGSGVERLLAASENQNDIFQTSLFSPIIKSIEKVSGKDYDSGKRAMRIIADHLVASVFIVNARIVPSNKDQGYVLRRLIRRASDNLGTDNILPIIESIIENYKDTDPQLAGNYEFIKDTIAEELQKYTKLLIDVTQFVKNKYKKTGDELKGQIRISADDAFTLYTTHGLSPIQLKSLGLLFEDQEFAEKIKAHQLLSKKGAEQKFKGGLADHSERTIMGHTATHLLHQALRDMFGKQLHQTGSNITSERVRFDFNFDRKLTEDELKQLEKTVNEKIKENLPVHFEIMPIEKAKETGAIGLFDEKYAKDVKVYFIGEYSVELCGGPHVNFTGEIKRFTIIKQESLGRGQQRIYAKVGE
ncbi:MAG: alanine--tRNA ligase [Candidatus Levyibacteriota bacterium]